MARLGNLFVISGPSGSGKGTVIAKVLEKIPDAALSVSATTRSPRPGEEDGVSYFFKTREEFEEMVAKGEFLEWAEYSGNLYGTPLPAVRRSMDEGKQVILEIDMQGAFQVREKVPEAHLVFIEPPSIEELRARLVGRGTEDEATIERRMAAAELELSHKMEYDYQVMNDKVDAACERLVAIINECAKG